ncbi:hypothetical protein K438DRAFT_1927380 [Mycena galopus ATCC 62051]|nr:hypothetical protein K438DRAFT_1927380 [Mycena galopus ATCC 62051]
MTTIVWPSLTAIAFAACTTACTSGKCISAAQPNVGIANLCVPVRSAIGAQKRSETNLSFLKLFTRLTQNSIRIPKIGTLKFLASSAPSRSARVGSIPQGDNEGVGTEVWTRRVFWGRMRSRTKRPRCPAEWAIDGGAIGDEDRTKNGWEKRELRGSATEESSARVPNYRRNGFPRLRSCFVSGKERKEGRGDVSCRDQGQA